MEINVASLGKERAQGLSDTGGKLPKGEAARLTVRDMARLLDDRWGDQGAAESSSAAAGLSPIMEQTLIWRTMPLRVMTTLLLRSADRMHVLCCTRTIYGPCPVSIVV